MNLEQKYEDKKLWAKVGELATEKKFDNLYLICDLILTLKSMKYTKTDQITNSELNKIIPSIKALKNYIKQNGNDYISSLNSIQNKEFVELINYIDTEIMGANYVTVLNDFFSKTNLESIALNELRNNLHIVYAEQVSRFQNL